MNLAVITELPLVMVLMHRQEQLAKQVSPKISIHNTLITTFGLHYNEYSGFFTNVLTLDDLFAE